MIGDIVQGISGNDTLIMVLHVGSMNKHASNGEIYGGFASIIVIVESPSSSVSCLSQTSLKSRNRVIRYNVISMVSYSN